MKNQNDAHKYDDIINLPHPTSKTRPRMALLDRAAQFAPFAALTGHDAAIKETARLTDKRIELDEYEKAILDERLQLLIENIEKHPVVTVTYFMPDGRKEGGMYLEETGIIKKIDDYERIVIMMDGQKIPVDEIIALSGEIFKQMDD